jgi:alpha-1,2-mannosyltransferase
VLGGGSLCAPLATQPVWAPALPFTYPPIAAILFLPLTVLPVQLSWGLIAALSVLAVGAVLRICMPGVPWRGACR